MTDAARWHLREKLAMWTQDGCPSKSQYLNVFSYHVSVSAVFFGTDDEPVKLLSDTFTFWEEKEKYA